MLPNRRVRVRDIFLCVLLSVGLFIYWKKNRWPNPAWCIREYRVDSVWKKKKKKRPLRRRHCELSGPTHKTREKFENPVERCSLVVHLGRDLIKVRRRVDSFSYFYNTRSLFVLPSSSSHTKRRKHTAANQKEIDRIFFVIDISFRIHTWNDVCAYIYIQRERRERRYERGRESRIE